MFKRINSLWNSVVTNQDQEKPSDSSQQSSLMSSSLGSASDAALLTGRLDELPRLSTNVVKIYISSNMSEFEVERRALWNTVLPQLRSSYLTEGLEIQFVDVHYGSSVDHAFDGNAFSRHLELISDCHRVSVGPFFVSLLGNRYGTIPLPVRIEQTEYSTLYNEAFESGKDIKLLDQWYRLDDLCQPPCFVLQPLQPHLNLIEGQSRIQREKSFTLWKEKHDQLVEILQESAAVCHKEVNLNQAPFEFKQNKYFYSSVHQELELALETSASNVLVVNRLFKDISTEDESAIDYLDITSNQNIDSAAQQRLQQLRDTLMNKLNSKSDPLIFTVEWKNGLDPDRDEEHAKYIKDFCSEVFLSLSKLIDRELVNHLCVNRRNENLKKIFREVVSYAHHSSVNGNIIKLNNTAPYLEESLMNFLNLGSKEEHHAVLVSGTEKSGKTTVLDCMKQLSVKTYGKSNTIVVPRFIGCMPVGKSSIELLSEICMQLSYVLKNDCPPVEFAFEQVVKQFASLISEFSKLGYQLVILLDNVDNMRENLGEMSTNFDWLLMPLPPKVHIVATCNRSSLAFQNLCNQMEWKIEKSDLNESQIVQLINEQLIKAKRLLSREQTLLLIDVVKFLPEPFFITFAIHELIIQDVKKLERKFSATTLEKLIIMCFKRLENSYGKFVVGRIVRYLLLTQKGLTEVELLDILSCDNEVLANVLSSDKINTLTFPFDVWFEIRSELEELLVENLTDNRLLLNWSYPCVTNVLKKRYCSNQTELTLTHQKIAEYFLGTRSSNRTQDSFDNKSDVTSQCLSQQPLLHSETLYNLRPLTEIWFQLLQTGNIESVKKNGFCNFEYLFARLHSTSLHRLQADLEMTFSSVIDADIYLILKSISKSLSILSTEPLQLASELVGHLRQLKDKYSNYIEPLIQQCTEWCDSYTLPLLVPLTTWLPDPREALVLCFTAIQNPSCFCCSVSGQYIFCTTKAGNEILMFHVPSKKQIRTFSGQSELIACLKVANERPLLVSGSVDGSIRVWETVSGRMLLLNRNHSASVLCILFMKNDSWIVTGSKDGKFGVTCVTSGETIYSADAHKSSITCLAITKTNIVLVTGSLDRTIKLWFTEDMTLMHVIDDQVVDSIVTLALSVDSTFLLVAFENGKVHVKSFVTGIHLHCLESHHGKVRGVAVSSDSIHCVVGCSDGNVYLYNIRSTELLFTYASHKEAVIDTHITGDQQFLFTASQDQICMWTFFKPGLLNVHTDEHTQDVTCIKISKDGRTAISGSSDSLVKLWNLDVSDFSQDLIGHTGAVTCVAIADDDAFAVSGSEDKTVKIWSVMMACVITDYREHNSTITAVYVMSDNLRVLSAEMRNVMKLWDAEHGTTQLSILGPVGLLSLSSTRELAISGNVQESSVKLWKVQDSQCIQNLSHVEAISCITFSEDSQYVVTGSVDMSLKVWEAATGKLTQVLVEHENVVSCVSISENNQCIVSGSHDCRLLVWNLMTGAVEQQLIGHTNHVTTVKITKDGSTAISGSLDNTLRVWSVYNGNTITISDLHYPITELFITANAERLVVRLLDSPHIPILCLHNSPAGEIKSQSQIQIQLTGETLPLPIKATQPVKNSSLGQPVEGVEHLKVESTSTSPKLKPKASPTKAPLQKAITAQETKRKMKVSFVDRESTSYVGGTSVDGRKKKESKKSSGICVLV